MLSDDNPEYWGCNDWNEDYFGVLARSGGLNDASLFVD